MQMIKKNIIWKKLNMACTSTLIVFIYTVLHLWNMVKKIIKTCSVFINQWHLHLYSWPMNDNSLHHSTLRSHLYILSDNSFAWDLRSLSHLESQLSHLGSQLSHPGSQLSHLGYQLSHLGYCLSHLRSRQSCPGSQINFYMGSAVAFRISLSFA